MNFDGYFEATEYAFASEKAQFLDRVGKMKDSWREAADLDRMASQLVTEMAGLKKLLSRGHLQILRTQEEILRIRLRNAQMAFRVRQLQSEIWRFLPYTHSNVPTVDYQLSIAKPPSGDEVEPTMMADQKLAAEITGLRGEWAKILGLQEAVFQDEMAHRESDNEFFNRFVADYQRQTIDTHKTIDAMLEKLIRRMLQEKSAASDKEMHQKSAIQTAEKRRQVLASKASNFAEAAARKQFEERERSQQQAAAETATARERIRAIEQTNLQKIAAMKEQNSELHQKHKVLTESVLKLKKKEQRLLTQNNGFLEKGKKRIEELECKMNALISAASAMENCPIKQHERMLNIVSGAVGHHGATSAKIEKLNLQIANVRSRLSQLSGR